MIYYDRRTGEILGKSEGKARARVPGAAVWAVPAAVDVRWWDRYVVFDADGKPVGTTKRRGEKEEIADVLPVKVPLIQDGEVTVIRTHRSIGDAVMMLGGIQDLASRGIRVHLKIHRNSRPLFMLHPAIHRLMGDGDRISTKTVVNLSVPCPAAEYESKANPHIRLNRIEVFALAMGSYTPQRPRLYVSNEEKEWGYEWIEERFGDVGMVVGLAHRCAPDGTWRDYPHWEKLIGRLDEIGIQVVHLDQFDDAHVSTKGLGLRQLIGVMSHMDLVVSVDTGLLHIAGGLGVPILGLFGPTDGKVRCNRYDAEILTGECPQMPCWYNYCVSPGKPAPCMKRISVDEIVRRIDEMIGRRGNG